MVTSVAAKKVLIEFQIILQHGRGGHAFADNRRARLRAQFLEQSGVGDQTVERGTESVNISRRDEKTVAFVVN